MIAPALAAWHAEYPGCGSRGGLRPPPGGSSASSAATRQQRLARRCPRAYHHMHKHLLDASWSARFACSTRSLSRKINMTRFVQHTIPGSVVPQGAGDRMWATGHRAAALLDLTA